MIKIGTATYFHKLNIKVTTTICEHAGDFFGDNPLARIGFSSETYIRRHFGTSGSFKASYPGTVYPDEFPGTGSVWPYADHKEVDNYVVTALEDNSAFHCFLPIGQGRLIDHFFVELTAGEEYIAEVGRIYCPTTSCILNGNPTKAFTMVACSENNSVITLDNDGKVAAFFAVTP